jgi:hypothetical protein
VGIYNTGSGPTLKAESVTALGENGSSNNYGLINTTATERSVKPPLLSNKERHPQRAGAGVADDGGGNVVDGDCGQTEGVL